MKILAASDIHDDKQTIEELLKLAEKEKVDAIVLAGDLTFGESNVLNIVGPFKKLGKPIILIPGNHETDATVEFWVKKYSPGVYNLHGRAMRIYDIGIFGVGGANIGLFQLDDDEFFEKLEKSHEKIKDARVKIMVTHAPPFGTKVDMIGLTHVGSKGIREAIEKLKPDICLCGHIHETFGIEDKIGKTRVINVGRKGVIIEIPKKKEQHNQ